LFLYNQPAGIKNNREVVKMTIAIRDFIAQVNVGEPQQSGKPAAESRPAPAAVMEAAAKSEYISYPSVGLGRDLRLTGQDIIKAGLVADD
jgi:hypothetical protein